MGVISYELDVTSSIPPSKLFQAFVMDSDELFPKAVPQAFKSIEILEGDGGPGTIKLITFGEGSQFKYAKQKVDALDKEKLSFGYSFIEGDALMNIFEKLCYEITIEAGPDGGSILKHKTTCYTLGDFQLNDDHIKDGKDKSLLLFKALEAYVLANP